ncbi:SRPBCC family protein [Amycolatopsis benzoatilytica]|uniref:SRPBCC family protein n=1 Tax=Amycolatopsis benzoatilytica TaxID=346045 RepID=UPI0003795FE4|nr:SRPBCC family protein [Amycolatopsis benzoatilytica]
MWSTDYRAETEASPLAVWAALRALHSGQRLSERSDRFELHGPFAKGTEISVTPQGQDTFRSRITELVENEVYEDETSFGDLRLRFRHTLAVRPDGGTVVTHRLEIDGEGADDTGPELGPQISEDFPVAMRDLLAFAERSVR